MQMDAKQLWQAVLGDMQVRLSRTAFDNWLRPTTIVGFADDVATIAAANTFSASTLQTRYAGEIEQVLSDIVGRPIRVTFTILNAHVEDEENREARVAETASLIHDARAQRGQIEETRNHATRQTANTRRGDNDGKTPRQPQQLQLSPTPTHGLNPRYVYEHYVVGSSNRFAHAASLSVAEQPGGRFNPFFVYGGVGLGKTHLLHAIGHRALELHPELSIVYVSSEKFTNDVINAIRSQKMEEFRGRYRSIDILMIDDIQFIAGKESTQEEFFHTFNALHQSGKQIIISSDKPPKAIAALEDRMRSRFEGGLITDVQLPDYEMRIAILRSKADELGESLPSDVVEYIAQKDQTNIRELEGALNKVLFHAQVTNQSVTLQLAMEALTDASIANRRHKITGEEIVNAVAKHYGVSRKDLIGRGRRQEIVIPRQMAMYLLREETEASLVDIGQELGKRDHTTVMHGITKIERELGTDTVRRSQLMAIREAIYTQNSE